MNTNSKNEDYDTLERRAIRAWFRQEGIGAAQPCHGRTEVKGDRITLTNVNGVLAVYEIVATKQGVRLRRMPCAEGAT